MNFTNSVDTSSSFYLYFYGDGSIVTRLALDVIPEITKSLYRQLYYAFILMFVPNCFGYLIKLPVLAQNFSK